jgi:hypothetical protein
MPIPDKKQNENKQKFVARCMSSEVMKKDYPDSKQRVAICLGQTKTKNKSSLIEDVHDNLLASNCCWDDDWDEFTWDIDLVPTEIYDEEGFPLMAAEKTKKKVTLNKPFRTPGGPKKFSVYVKNDKGNVVKVNFGDPNMEIKRDDPERRKSYRARHNCDNPGPKWKANYWSCKMWSKTNVSDLM